MKKRDVTRDLFLVLKEVIDTNLLDIINGTYNYTGKFAYLNELPIELIHLHIEKIMHATNKRAFNDNENPLEYLELFIRNFKETSINVINRNKLLNMKYAFKIGSYNLRQSSGKSKFSKKIRLCLVLAIITVNLATIATQSLSDDKITEFEINNQSYGASQELIDDQYDLETTESFASEVYYSENKGEQAKTIIPKVTNEGIEESTPKELTTEEKVQNILEAYNLTQEQFEIVCAIVTAEAKPGSYEDAYCVINTMYNRINSKTWVSYINSLSSVENAGNNIYYQATFPSQFVVYEEGRYKEFLGMTDTVGYLATIDMLTSRETVHDYLSFRAAYVDLDDCNQIVEDGNKYFNILEDDDRIEVQTDITRK